MRARYKRTNCSVVSCLATIAAWIWASVASSKWNLAGAATVVPLATTPIASTAQVAARREETNLKVVGMTVRAGFISDVVHRRICEFCDRLFLGLGCNAYPLP